MNTNQPPRIFDDAHKTAEGSLAKNFVANVFSWMVVGLLITGFVASYAASSDLYKQLVGSGGLKMWVILLSPFAFIIAINAGLQKFSATTLTVLFLAFSGVMGLSLSSVFLVYSMGSITQVFLITAGTFAVMEPMEYTRKTELKDRPITPEKARKSTVRVVALNFCKPAFIAMINAKGESKITHIIRPPDPTNCT